MHLAQRQPGRLRHRQRRDQAVLARDRQPAANAPGPLGPHQRALLRQRAIAVLGELGRPGEPVER